MRATIISVLVACAGATGCGGSPAPQATTPASAGWADSATDKAPTALAEAQSLRSLLAQRDQELDHLSRGTTLLVGLQREKERYRVLFDFLETFDRSDLRCTIRPLTEFPLVLFSFHRAYVKTDGTDLPVFERKSALVLVDAGTGRAIDVIVGAGYRTEGHTTGQPWTTEWQRRDGSRERYRILVSGFELTGGGDSASDP